MEFEIKHKIWVESNGKLLMGRGHAELLRALAVNPSLTQAAKQLKMSYSKAWKLMKQLNSRAKQPVVMMRPGGKTGGQTQLTPYGEKLLAFFWQTHQEYEAFLRSKGDENKEAI